MTAELFSTSPETDSNDNYAASVLGKIALEEQIINEIWYSDAIVIDVLPASEHLTGEQIIDGMETNHAVKAAPYLADQLRDTGRENKITTKKTKGVEQRTVTEHDALVELDEFLTAAEDSSLVISRAGFDGYLSKVPIRESAADIRGGLTFIGEKEYDEAAAGIATYWKSWLETNPDKRLYIATRWIATQNYDSSSYKRAVKSDSYLMDAVLSNFSDEELERFADQIATNEDEIMDQNPQDVRVVFLDDWTVSGEQLTVAVDAFLRRFPDHAASTEVQLIAASEARIRGGFVTNQVGRDRGSLSDALPLRAYYVAHEDKSARQGQARITGAHSSVDYNFRDDIEVISYMAEEVLEGDSDSDDPSLAILAKLPVLADIERPYNRYSDVEKYELTEEKRLFTIRNKQQ